MRSTYNNNSYPYEDSYDAAPTSAAATSSVFDFPAASSPRSQIFSHERSFLDQKASYYPEEHHHLYNHQPPSKPNYTGGFEREIESFPNATVVSNSSIWESSNSHSRRGDLGAFASEAIMGHDALSFSHTQMNPHHRSRHQLFLDDRGVDRGMSRESYLQPQYRHSNAHVQPHFQPRGRSLLSASQLLQHQNPLQTHRPEAQFPNLNQHSSSNNHSAASRSAYLLPPQSNHHLTVHTNSSNMHSSNNNNHFINHEYNHHINSHIHHNHIKNTHAAPAVGSIAAAKGALFVGDLSFFASESDLRRLFSNYGKLKRAEIKRGRFGDSLMHGFVELESLASAQLALTELANVKFLGRQLRIHWAYSNAQKSSPRDREAWTQLHVTFTTPRIDILVSEEVLDKLFEAFGAVADVTVKKHARTIEPAFQSGYAFVYFYEPQAAIDAVEYFKDRVIEDIHFESSLSFRSQRIVETLAITQTLGLSSASGLDSGSLITSHTNIHNNNINNDNTLDLFAMNNLDLHNLSLNLLHTNNNNTNSNNNMGIKLNDLSEHVLSSSPSSVSSSVSSRHHEELHFNLGANRNTNVNNSTSNTYTNNSNNYYGGEEEEQTHATRDSFDRRDLLFLQHQSLSSDSILTLNHNTSDANNVHSNSDNSNDNNTYCNNNNTTIYEKTYFATNSSGIVNDNPNCDYRVKSAPPSIMMMMTTDSSTNNNAVNTDRNIANAVNDHSNNVGAEPETPTGLAVALAAQSLLRD